MNVDVAVIGAGISGLTAAYELKRRGHSVAVLECQANPGGKAHSERFGGFLMEHGPSTVSALCATTSALSSRLGLDGERCDLSDGVRNRYLLKDSRLQGLPLGWLGLLRSSYLSPAGRARLFAEALINRSTEDGGDESVAAFSTRRFGREFADMVIDPLVGGLFAARAEEMSVRTAFPQLVELERRYGSIALGLLLGRRKGRRMPGRRVYSWRGGIGCLPAALVGSIGDSLQTGVTVNGLRPSFGGYRIETRRHGSLAARSVIVATQPHVTASLLDGLDAEAASIAADIATSPLAVAFFGFRREQIAHPLDGLGFLVPSSQPCRMTGTLFGSTMFPGGVRPRGMSRSPPILVERGTPRSGTFPPPRSWIWLSLSCGASWGFVASPR